MWHAIGSGPCYEGREKMSKVYFEIIHDGRGEQRFDGRCLEIECRPHEVAAARRRIQDAIDAWKADSANVDKLDQHGNAKDDLTVEEFLAIIPTEFHATMTDVPIRSAFI
jgi:hypothetical protein